MPDRSTSLARLLANAVLPSPASPRIVTIEPRPATASASRADNIAASASRSMRPVIGETRDDMGEG